MEAHSHLTYYILPMVSVSRFLVYPVDNLHSERERERVEREREKREREKREEEKREHAGASLVGPGGEVGC